MVIVPRIRLPVSLHYTWPQAYEPARQAQPSQEGLLTSVMLQCWGEQVGGKPLPKEGLDAQAAQEAAAALQKASLQACAENPMLVSLY